jgi:hypothetical protein
VELGYFDWQKKEYGSIPLDEQVEVSRCSGTSRSTATSRSRLRRRYDPESGLALICLDD